MPELERTTLQEIEISDLRAANHMYRFSLKSFQRLFAKALSAESPSAAVEARVSMLASTLLFLLMMPTLRTSPSIEAIPSRAACGAVWLRGAVGE